MNIEQSICLRCITLSCEYFFNPSRNQWRRCVCAVESLAKCRTDNIVKTERFHEINRVKAHFILL